MCNLKDLQYKRLLTIKNKHKGKNCMRSCNPVYPLPQGALYVHINGVHNHVSRYKSYF